MSTTRLLAKMDKPNSVLYFAATGYEKHAAELRNAAVESMEKNDIAKLAWQYLESSDLTGNRNQQTAMFGFFTAALILESILTYDPISLLIPAIASLVLAPLANSRITLTETTDACEAWLEQKLGRESVEHIKQIPLTSEGLFNLKNMMMLEGVNTDSMAQIENQLRQSR